ncbi:hypothetical protein ACSQ67_024208 [Phaseolus vulgaris]
MSNPGQTSKGLTLDDFAPSFVKKLEEAVPSSSSGRVLPKSLTSQNKFTVLGRLPENSNESPIEFVLKEQCETLLALEPEFENKEPHEIIPFLAPHWSWIPQDNVKKTKKYYQFIILDTGSAEIIPEKDKNNPSIICYSKLKISKVLGFEDWNQKPLTEKRFSRPFDPPSYNYFDYQEAWFKILRESNPRHSWYISFKNPLQKYPPVWFQEWFCTYGPTKSILPPAVHKPTPFPQHLCLKVKVFWWKKFQISYLEDKYRQWKNKSLTPTTPQKKEKALAIAGKSKGEMRAALLQALSSLGSDDEEEILEIADFQQNEDDCLNLDLL